MIKNPKVYADFGNADPQGRVRLICHGTLEDLSRLQVELQEGLCLTLYADDVNANGEDDDLLAEGVATYSQEESCWVAVIDWAAIRHVSEDGANGPNARS